MEPNVIAPLQGGIVDGRSATYDERDAFGTLGGRARMEAAALLAKKLLQAKVLATDAVNATELTELGVAPERVELIVPDKNTTSAALQTIAAHARGTVAIVSNEYHLPRVRAMWGRLPDPKPAIEFVSAEGVLTEANPTFAKKFEEIKKTPAYRERLQNEEHGVAAIMHGDYQEAGLEKKKERPV